MTDPHDLPGNAADSSSLQELEVNQPLNPAEEPSSDTIPAPSEEQSIDPSTAWWHRRATDEMVAQPPMVLAAPIEPAFSLPSSIPGQRLPPERVQVQTPLRWPTQEVVAPRATEPSPPIRESMPPIQAPPVQELEEQVARGPIGRFSWLKPTKVGMAMVAILVLAASLRFYGLNWDAGHHLHPDERFITTVASAVRLPSPESYFDSARSTLNPNALSNVSYVYGTFPLIVTRLVAETVQAVVRAAAPGDQALELIRRLRDLGGYDNVALLGRALSAVSDLFTIFLVFLIGRRLHGAPVGLLAALLTSLMVLMIQTAHFFTVEAPLTLFTTLGFYFALRAAQSGSLTDWSLFGIATGLAAATKPTGLMLAVVALVAMGVYWYRVCRLDLNQERRRFVVEDLGTGGIVWALLAFLVFRFTQPYAFAGPGIFDLAFHPRYLEVLAGFQRIAVGEADVPFNISWAGAPALTWQLVNMGLWGMGVPLALAAWGGVAFALYQIARNPRQHYVHLFGLVWVIVNFAYWGIQFTKLMRYVLPIYPQLAIFAALALVSLWQWARQSRASDNELAGGELDEGFTPPARRARLSMPRAILGRGLAAIVVGWTALYSLGFVSIYSQPVTRVRASEWIYANVPPGSRVGSEHWDDRLPLGFPGKESSMYKSVDFALYSEETPEKRNELSNRLDEADYIVLSSNRLYGSIPKLPQRYPVGTRYYQALFGGELGFERAAEFTQRPGLFGIELNDDDAEESFTVYDHPKVTIFKKAANYSSEKVRSIIGSVSLNNVLRNLKPIQAGSRGLLLDSATWAADRAGGTWRDTFDRGSFSNTAPLLVWWLAIELLGFLALPLTWFVCRRLADAGYVFAKTLSLLALAWIPWFLGSVQILPYTALSVWVSVLVIAAASVLVILRNRSEIVGDLRMRLRPIIGLEAIFNVTFLGFLLMRAVNPDLWHSAYGGEKPMDFAYLNAIIKTTWFPSYDPWFAGGYLNYYYFGQVIIASVIKLTGIVPWVAYNLALPTIAGLVAASVASIVYNILIDRVNAPARRRNMALFGSVAGATLAVLLGNLAGIVQIGDWLMRLDRTPIQSPVPLVTGALSLGRGAWAWATAPFGQNLTPFNFDFWGPTRVITTEGTAPITEFPYFTFLYGDLHAHMIAMPIGLFVAALALNIVRQPDWVPQIMGRTFRQLAGDSGRALFGPGGLSLILAGVTIGIIRMTNSWDFPTYLGLMAVCIGLAEALRPGRSWDRVVFRTVMLMAVVVVANQVAIGPYLRTNELFYSGVDLSRSRTTAPHYLIIMGGFLSILGLYLAFHISALRLRLGEGALGVIGEVTAPNAGQGVVAGQGVTIAERHGATGMSSVIVGLLGAIAFLSALFALGGAPVIGISAMGIGLMLAIAALRPLSRGSWFMFLLAATALAIIAGVEVFVLKGDMGRMNTVFKFYLQAWLLLSIACGAMIALMVRRARGSRWLLSGWRRWSAYGVAALLAITAIYPALGTPSKIQHRFTWLPLSLDGMEFMAFAQYKDEKGDMMLPDDFAAINWMLDNIQGSPVIVEGLAGLYHWRSRVSAYTGLPTVIGWDWHQKQQRGEFGYMVDERVRDVELIYTSPSPEIALSLLKKYGVEYLYVGGVEKGYHGSQGSAKFERMVGSSLDRVYQSGAVTIYRVMA